ncbi:MAG: NAD(+) kinase [Thermotoga caldifontis]|uniref:NAD(+) kinase n=1 Tax=Thermotoga caldifontis TaxID=1508419 RepID=UPI003C7A825E
MSHSCVILYKSGRDKEARELFESVRKHLKVIDVQELSCQRVEKACDFALVVGGDGTVLRAVKCVSVPIVGFKAGRIGFLTAYRVEEAERFLEDLRNGNLVREDRWMLKVTVDQKEYEAVNDVILRAKAKPMSEFRVFIDGCSDLDFFADGILVSTPTGSTAYNLSLGGAIVIPSCDVVQIMPVAPYYLQNRSIVLPATKIIRISSQLESELVIDGVCVGTTREILVNKSDKTFSLLRPAGYDFFSVLKSKVGYGRSVNES